MSKFLFGQIVRSIKLCLEKNVVHKDIKVREFEEVLSIKRVQMENIVVDLKTGETTLIDFGAATSKNVKTKEIQGKP